MTNTNNKFHKVKMFLKNYTYLGSKFFQKNITPLKGY